MDELEREAIAIWKANRLLLQLNRPFVAFLRRVAERLEWKEFSKLL